MLREFELLVAGRDGAVRAAARIRRGGPLPGRGALDAISATEVRERAARGDVWEHLVPGSARAALAPPYLILT